MKTELEDDRIILHDLRGVNLTVGFFLDTEISLYSICWRKVDVRVELCNFIEQVSEQSFPFSTQQLFIDDRKISGDVIDFRCEPGVDDIINVYCKIVILWD